MDRSEPATEVTFCRLAAAFVSSGSGGHSRDPRPSAERTGPASPDRGVGGTIGRHRQGGETNERQGAEDRSGTSLAFKATVALAGIAGERTGAEQSGAHPNRITQRQTQRLQDASGAFGTDTAVACRPDSGRACTPRAASSCGGKIFSLPAGRRRSWHKPMIGRASPEGPRRRSPFPTPPGVPPCYIPAGNICVSGIAAVRHRQGGWG